MLGNSHEANRLIHEVINRNNCKNIPDLYTLRIIIVEITATIMKTVAELKDANTISEEEMGEESKQRLLRLAFEHDTIDEALRVIEADVCDICSCVVKKRKNKSQKLRDEILEIVHENYSDCGLSLKMVAAETDISLNYLSSFFKRHIGIGFGDYVSEYRIARAREYLENEELSINDIAAMTGFVSANGFIRTFKKLEGVTPGQYRQKI